jgi:aryl-alcohol dehydrogenase-like predicted oxidoreductase
VVATKFGWDIDPVERKPRGRVTSRPEVIRRVVDGSLHRLGVDAIDLYYQHRESISAFCKAMAAVEPAMPPPTTRAVRVWVMTVAFRRLRRVRRGTGPTAGPSPSP